MSDWDEIKRLAADFQRTQTSDTLQKISERNCIDIIKKLTELNLIELIYTCDGREFITPEHLLKEIEDEIYVNGGRMHLHDLASKLNVDYQHVENKAKELPKDEYSLILGQVIHSTYKTTLGKQINDYMLINGQLSIAEFSKSLDLPSEFLLTIVQEILPKVVDDYVVGKDGRTYYTTDTMDKYRSIIAGTLSAITKPTSIASVMKRLDIPERIFIPIVDDLIKDGRIDATIENRIFIPTVHAREQNEWITTFYSANSYIEYDVLIRMDIKQPKAFLKKRFPSGIQLKTCFISPSLLSQVESLIEDCITSNSWIDLSTIVPSAIESDDIEQLLLEIFKKNKQFSSSCLTLNQTNVCSLGFISTCKDSFRKLMQSKADEHLKQGRLMNYFLGSKIKESTRKEIESSKKEPVESKSESKPETNKFSENKPDEEISETNKGEKEPSQIQDDEMRTPGKGNKRERKDKKGKAETIELPEDSDEDLSSKKSKSRKSGGGTQGREIKQKATKKKYIPGNKGKNNEHSDEESIPSKTPRSNKGRAARRGLSPEGNSSTNVKSKGPKSNIVPEAKEPLIFLDTDEIVEKLKLECRGSGDGSEEFFESIANTIEQELNSSYQSLARQVLDDYLRSKAEESADPNINDDVDLVE